MFNLTVLLKRAAYTLVSRLFVLGSQQKTLSLDMVTVTYDFFLKLQSEIFACLKHNRASKSICFAHFLLHLPLHSIVSVYVDKPRKIINKEDGTTLCLYRPLSPA